MSRSGVYEIRNTTNGSRYVGSSSNILERFINHKNLLRRNKHHSVNLQRAWNKYGENSFIFKVLLYCDVAMNFVYEQMCIDGMNPAYNMAKDAAVSGRGLRKSEEHKRKLSEANKGKHQEWLGRRHTEEEKQKISQAHIGRVRGAMSEEQKRKISNAGKGRPKSEDWKMKASEAAKRRWARERGEL